VLACAPALAQQLDERDIGVRIQRDGARIIVDVHLPVAATAIEAWAVMTDYDHMASFVSNLESSRIIERTGNTLTIEQKGRASRGPLSFAFQNVREIVLTPPSEIRSRLISGDLKASEFTTRVVDHGDSAEIVNHGEFIPKVWVPPIIGPAVIEQETRKQFAELRAEILRRKAESVARAR
jgi:hypothetical protein